MKFLLVLSLLLSACAKHVSTREELVHRGRYAYQRLNEGEYLVAAVSDVDVKRALEEIGCGKKYLCAVDHDGEIYTVEIHEK
jgi:alpha-tubulin suppressor-like RCC1 family protein